VIPAQAGIRNVKSKETVLSDKFPCRQARIPALYDALYQRGALLFLTFPFDSQVKGAFLCQQQM
ncbi:TPA: hypothetical protein ACFJKF_002108, partial [Neisseria gonorrhoeae]